MATDKAQIVITAKLASRINLLHNQVESGNEWSGLLVFRITKGGINDLKNLEISCEDVYPMDFGDATFTSFEGGEDWLKFFDQFPEVNPLTKEEGWYLGKIHSHHSMQAFHSGTDTDDLYENAPKLPFFLSLVVNYSCQPFAEIGVAATSEVKQVKRFRWSLNNWLEIGETKVEKTAAPEPAVYVIPCDVLYEEDAWFVDRLAEVRKKPKTSRGATYPSSNMTNKNIKDQAEDEADWWKRRYHLEPGVGTYSATPQLKSKIMANLSEFLTFDVDPNTSPYQALSHASRVVPIEKRLTYKKALKQYFTQYWYPNTFDRDKTTPKEVLTVVEEFVKSHPQLWASGPLTEVLHELKIED